MFCKKCGKENDNDARFCSKCGTFIGTEEKLEPEKELEEVTEEEPKVEKNAEELSSVKSNQEDPAIITKSVKERKKMSNDKKAWIAIGVVIVVGLFIWILTRNPEIETTTEEPSTTEETTSEETVSFTDEERQAYEDFISGADKADKEFQKMYGGLQSAAKDGVNYQNKADTKEGTEGYIRNLTHIKKIYEQKIFSYPDGEAKTKAKKVVDEMEIQALTFQELATALDNGDMDKASEK